MKRIAVTGGIAMGKSTVMWMLQDMGAEVINADDIAHALLEPKGHVWKALFERYGDRIMQSGGVIDRAALGRIVFGDERERAFVEHLMHPRIHDEILRLGAAAQKKGRSYVVVEIPLLFEIGGQKEFDVVIVVRCTRQQQLERCMTKFNLTHEEALQRIKIQRPIDEKATKADFIIESDASLQETRVQVHRLFTTFEKGIFK